MQILISWPLQKPTDLDLHCLLRQGMLCLAREGLNKYMYKRSFESNEHIKENENNKVGYIESVHEQ